MSTYAELEAQIQIGPLARASPNGKAHLAVGLAEASCKSDQSGHRTTSSYALQAKTFATVQAALAFHCGLTVFELRDGGYHVCWANTFHQCVDLDALTAFAEIVGAI